MINKILIIIAISTGIIGNCKAEHWPPSALGELLGVYNIIKDVEYSDHNNDEYIANLPNILDNSVKAFSIILNFESKNQDNTINNWGSRSATQNEIDYGVMNFIAQTLAKASEILSLNVIFNSQNNYEGIDTKLSNIIKEMNKLKISGSKEIKQHFNVCTAIINRKIQVKSLNICANTYQKTNQESFFNIWKTFINDNSGINSKYINDLLTDKKGVDYFNAANNLRNNIKVADSSDYNKKTDELDDFCKKDISEFVEQDLKLDLPDIHLNSQLIDEVKYLSDYLIKQGVNRVSYGVRVDENNKPVDIDKLSNMNLYSVFINIDKHKNVNKLTDEQLSKLIKPGVVDVSIYGWGNSKPYIAKLPLLKGLKCFSLTSFRSDLKIDHIKLPNQLAMGAKIYLSIKNIIIEEGKSFLQNLDNPKELELFLRFNARIANKYQFITKLDRLLDEAYDYGIHLNINIGAVSVIDKIRELALVINQNSPANREIIITEDTYKTANGKKFDINTDDESGYVFFKKSSNEKIKQD